MVNSEEPPQSEFRDGLRNITKALADAVTKIGVVTNFDDIHCEPPWEFGKQMPEAAKLRIAPVGAPALLVDFSKEQIQDCWRGLDRADVRQKVRNAVDRYRRLRAEG
jgi:hypothetical protein